MQLSQQTQALKSGLPADPDYPALDQGQSVMGADQSISGEGWGSGGGVMMGHCLHVLFSASVTLLGASRACRHFTFIASQQSCDVAIL